MWKRIGLFSFLFLFFVLSFNGSESGIPKKLLINVEVVSQFNVDKPLPFVPSKLSIPSIGPLDLSKYVLESPKELEVMPIQKPPDNALSCGQPEDLIYYRNLVRDYYENNYYDALKNFNKLSRYSASVYFTMGSYVMGIIEQNRNNLDTAKNLFFRACSYTNIYQQGACDAYYGLSLKLSRNYNLIQSSTYHSGLWKTVLDILNSKSTLETHNCQNYVFKNYCSYINAFVKGEVLYGPYQNSLYFRKGIVSYYNNDLKKAKSIFEDIYKNYNLRTKERYMALYYLALIDLKENHLNEAMQKAVMIENIYPGSDEALNLYSLISTESYENAEIASLLAGNKSALLTKIAAIKAYNEVDYNYSLILFNKIKDYKDGVYACAKLNDFKCVLNELRHLNRKDEFYYTWLLESYYRLGDLMALKDTLSDEVFDIRYKSLKDEYLGWYYFKQKDWDKALTYFNSDYYKAIVLFNKGDYQGVINLLKNDTSERSKILLAKAYLSLGEPSKVFDVIKNPKTDEEKYLYGIAYFIENDFEKALSYFSAVASSNSSLNKAALLKLGDTYYNMGSTDKALLIYKKVVDDFPNSKEAMEAAYDIISSNVKNPSKDVKIAIEDFLKRYPNSPFSNDLKYQLANIYAKEGNTDTAKILLSQITSGPRVKALLKIATLTNNPAKKESLLKQVINEGDPKEKEEAIKLLTEFYVSQNEPQKAAELYEMGQSEDDLIKAYELYISNNNLNKARDILDKLIKTYNDDKVKKLALNSFSTFKDPSLLEFSSSSTDDKVKAESYFLLGNYYANKKLYKEALKNYLSVVLLTPDQKDLVKSSILRSVNILIKLHAYEDASCLLNRLDESSLSNKELIRVKLLKKKLPVCTKKLNINLGGK